MDIESVRCLGFKPHLELKTRCSLILEVFKHNRSCRSQCKMWMIPGPSHIYTYVNTAWQLLFCTYGAPSLTRGQVCHLSIIICGRKTAVSMHISIYILHFITWHDSQYMQYIQVLFQSVIGAALPNQENLMLQRQFSYLLALSHNHRQV
jgi:hypothetical protein